MVGNRTGRVRHFFWVFPAGLFGEHPQESAQGVGFTTSTCSLHSFLNFFSQGLQFLALLKLFLTLLHPTQWRAPAF